MEGRKIIPTTFDAISVDKLLFPASYLRGEISTKEKAIYLQPLYGFVAQIKLYDSTR